MNTLTKRRNAAHKAASRLMRKGLDCGRDLRSPQAIDWLAEVALHIGSLDPIEIGAGAIRHPFTIRSCSMQPERMAA